MIRNSYTPLDVCSDENFVFDEWQVLWCRSVYLVTL